MKAKNTYARMVSRALLAFGVMSALGGIGCANQAADMLNPFAENPDKELGERNTNALMEGNGNNGRSGAENARHALEVMSTYRRAQAPQPSNPVVQPAEVRLMWVPDHLNKSGDLVPAHYYYLRVLNDRWAVQDAYEIEEQLNAGTPQGGGATPYIVKGAQ